MDRKRFLKCLLALPAAPMALAACRSGRSTPPRATAMASDSLRVHASLDDFESLEKPDSAWRELLTEREYHILFEAGTEPRGSSALLDEKRAGSFICAACYLPLFSSKTKFDSGTGWPSFWAPLSDRNVDTMRDTKLGYARTEYHCARCGGHQGHVFEDGPEPTGLRYCNNGAALDFVPADQELPALRT